MKAGGGKIGTGPLYDPSKSTAAISGKILYKGSRPALVPVQMSADPACMQAHTSPVYEQTIEVNQDGTLKDVFVYVKQGAGQWSYRVPTEPAMLDQHGCMYMPHVLGLMVGQPLKIHNSDDTLHNVHAMPKNNPAWNLGQPVAGMETIKTFSNPEVMIPVRCDVHHWMLTFIGVVAHPFFAVTGNDGTFRLSNLPAGSYTIEAWHEKLGAQSQQVSVADHETKELNFTF